MDTVHDPDWLAAFAVGLTYASCSRTDAVHQLQLAAGGRAEALDEARLRLRALTTLETPVGQAATSLLDTAAGSVSSLG